MSELRVLLVIGLFCFAQGGKLLKYGTSTSLIDHDPVDIKWFEQTLDHFNPADNRKWKQKYFVDDLRYKKGSPIVLQIGGEQPLWNATYFNGPLETSLQFGIEHRFYGDSLPFGEDSFRADNLKYLSSEQAIEDVAKFIKTMNVNWVLGPNPKWIVWGGSYSASLATWARMKYPELIIGAIAHSAPLEANINFHEFYDFEYFNVTNVLVPKCGDTLRAAVDKLTDMINEKKYGKISTLFGFKFRGTKADRIKFVTLIDKLFITGEFGSGKTTVQHSCNFLLNNTKGNLVERLAQTIVVRDKTEFVKLSGWAYQKCTEFGWFHAYEFFGLDPLQDLTNARCQQFGEEINNMTKIQEKIAHTNRVYGGKSPNVTNVVFTHGEFDPWRIMGLNEDLSETAVVFIVKGGTHCSGAFDPKAEIFISKHVEKWLQDFEVRSVFIDFRLNFSIQK